MVSFKLVWTLKLFLKITAKILVCLDSNIMMLSQAIRPKKVNNMFLRHFFLENDRCFLFLIFFN